MRRVCDKRAVCYPLRKRREGALHRARWKTNKQAALPCSEQAVTSWFTSSSLELCDYATVPAISSQYMSAAWVSRLQQGSITFMKTLSEPRSKNLPRAARRAPCLAAGAPARPSREGPAASICNQNGGRALDNCTESGISQGERIGTGGPSATAQRDSRSPVRPSDTADDYM